MALQFDLLAMGFPWLELTGNVNPQIAVVSESSLTLDLDRDSTLTYKLFDGTTEIGSGTMSVFDHAPSFLAFSATVTLTATLQPGKIYRERIYGTVTDADGDSYPVSIEREAYATSYPIRVPPMSWRILAGSNPALGSQLWQGQLRVAWFTLCAWIASQRNGVLWTTAAMMPALRSLTLALIHEAKAEYGSTSALALATYHRTAYSNAIEAIRLGWDKDGDGTIDNVQSAASAGGGVGG